MESEGAVMREEDRVLLSKGAVVDSLDAWDRATNRCNACYDMLIRLQEMFSYNPVILDLVDSIIRHTEDCVRAEVVLERYGITGTRTMYLNAHKNDV